MSAATPADIRRQQQADLRREIRNLGKRKRRLERSHAVSEPKALPTVALMVYVVADYNAEVAVDFLKGKGRGKQSYVVEHSQEDLVAWVETACLDTPDATLRDLLDEPAADDAPSTAKCKRRDLMQAGRYVLEHALFQWTVNQNTVHGVAPSRDLLVSHARGIIPSSLPQSVRARLSSPLNSSARTQRKWLRSFRRRWGARVGGLPNRKHLPQELIRSKAQTLVKHDLFVHTSHTVRVIQTHVESYTPMWQCRDNLFLQLRRQRIIVGSTTHRHQHPLERSHF
jgi:hypothetical protein